MKVAHGVAYRIHRGQFICALVDTMVAVVLGGEFNVEHDDGGGERIILDDKTLSANTQANLLISRNGCKKDGWITGGQLVVVSGPVPPRGATYAQMYVVKGQTANSGKDVWSTIGSGSAYTRHVPSVGVFDEDEYATWVFFGTVGEDATGGTHVCSLTVSPGAGNELELMYCGIQVGNSATSQAVAGLITDGSNQIVAVFNPNAVGGTVASLNYAIPNASQSAAIDNTGLQALSAYPGIRVAGTMKLILQVTTAAVSLTQTFGLACRVKGALPTAVLADNVGTPTLTTTTNQVF